MKKVIIATLLCLAALAGFSQSDPYKTTQTVSNSGTVGIVNGGLKVMGPMFSAMTDTLHALAIPKYRGAIVTKLSDSLTYINTGAYWRAIEQPLHTEFPLYVENGILKFADPGMFNNKLIGTGGITLDDHTVTVASTIKWTFNGELKTQAFSSDFVIPDATDLRVDIIYIDSLGNMEIQQGTEDTERALEPEIPYNAIKVARVDVDQTSISVNPTPSYQPTGILYADGTGAPKTNAADFYWSEALKSLNLGSNSTIGTTTELSMNSFRAKLLASFNGLRINVGSGYSGAIDASKTISFENRGSVYGTFGSTTTANHYFKLGANTKLKVTNIDSLGSPYNMAWFMGDSLVKGPVPSGSGGGVGWNLTGNSGTNHLTDFVGTIDAEPFYLRVNGDTSAKFGIDGNISLNKGIATGQNSFATGLGSSAAGYASISTGISTNATGIGSLTAGTSTNAMGDYSISFGNSSSASTEASIAMGYSASAGGGQAAIALGAVAIANGNGAVAIGNSVNASGTGAVSLGYTTNAISNAATSTGYNTTASGLASFSGGNNTLAKASNAFTIGEKNDDTDSPDPVVRNPLDRIFQIGNGDSVLNTNANVLTILRNGKIGVGSNVLVPSATIHLDGTFRYVDGNEGNSKVLTSDANGNATWQTPAGGSSSTDAFGEEATGSTSSTITLSHSALTNTVRIYKNGMRLPAAEFSVSGTTVTLTSARITSDIFITDYKY